MGRRSLNFFRGFNAMAMASLAVANVLIECRILSYSFGLNKNLSFTRTVLYIIMYFCYQAALIRCFEFLIFNRNSGFQTKSYMVE